MKGALSTLTTSLFNATILFNSTDVIFDIRFTVSPSEVGWFSIGHGTTMSNSRMMIMWPVSKGKDELHWMKAYCKASGHALPTPVISAALDSVRIEGWRGKNQPAYPTLQYARPLTLSAEDTFRRAQDQKLVWAMSSIRPNIDDGNLGLTFHDKGYGSAILDFSSQNPVDGLARSGASKVKSLIHSRRHDSLITVHATLLTFAWVLCAPLAILLARYLRQKDSQKWIQVHWMLQVANLVLTSIGILCATLAVGTGSHCDTAQKRLGFFVFFGMLLQAAEGYIIHRTAQQPRRMGQDNVQPRKSIGNRIHKVSGCVLVMIAWLTIVFGIKEWEFLGRGTPLAVSILIGITCSLSIVLYGVLVLRNRSGTLNQPWLSRFFRSGHTNRQYSTPEGELEGSEKDQKKPDLSMISSH